MTAKDLQEILNEISKDIDLENVTIVDADNDNYGEVRISKTFVEPDNGEPEGYIIEFF